MIVRCWGARGSIPVSGAEYLRYGGDTPCIEIRTGSGDVVIVDAGSGIRSLGNRLLEEGRRDFTMIFTHAHWDHIMGFPFFKPIYREKTRIDVLGCPFAQDSVQGIISCIMSPPNFPVAFDEIAAEIRYGDTCRESQEIGGMAVSSIPLNHPNQGMGYRFEENGKSFVFLTDNELGHRHPGGVDFSDYLEFSKDADLLIHDAMYRPDDYKLTRSWGHSVYTDALRLALDARVPRLGLFHHDPERTDSELDGMVEACRRMAAGRPLDCFALHQGMEILL